MWCVARSKVLKASEASTRLTEVINGFGMVPQRIIRVAEVRVRPPLYRPVAYLLCNRQVLPVVLDGLVKAPQRLIRSPRN